MTKQSKARKSITGTGTLKILVLLIGLALFGYGFSSCTATKDPSENENVSGYDPLAGDTNTADSDAPNSISKLPPDSPELAKFTHTNEHHAQLSCLICHRRDTEATKIDFPGKENHSPCIGCHVAQFKFQKSPICSICHTESETGALKDFPPLRGFNAKFDHAKHLRLTSCATCHKNYGRGVALTIPSRGNAHATCFQCHTASAENQLSSCDVCHEPGRAPQAPQMVRAAYSKSFSHASHRSMSCTDCHTVYRSGGRGNQVTAPAARMHLVSSGVKSCATCHNERRAFGGDDFSNCQRCHQGNSFGFSRPRL